MRARVVPVVARRLDAIGLLGVALLASCNRDVTPSIRSLPTLVDRPSTFQLGETIPFHLRIDLHRADGIDGDLDADLLVSVLDSSADRLLFEDRFAHASAHPARGDTLGLSLASELVGATVRAGLVEGQRQRPYGGKQLRELMNAGFHQLLPVIDLSRAVPGRRQELSGKPFDMYRRNGIGLYQESVEQTACPGGASGPCTAWHRGLLPDSNGIEGEDASNADAVLDQRGVPLWIHYGEHFNDEGEVFGDGDTYIGLVDVQVTIQRVSSSPASEVVR